MAFDSPHATLHGRVVLWGGIGLGAIVLVAGLTHGFGLLRSHPRAEAASTGVQHKDGRLTVPEGSPLRERILVAAAQTRDIGATLRFPATVEVDPARAAAVLPPASGRVVELRVGLGDRVRRGQALVLIESPDLAQALDDFDKARDAQDLSQRKLDRMEQQSRIGTSSEQDLEQARSDRTQAGAELARAQERLAVLGSGPDTPRRPAVLTVRAPFDGSITALSVARGAMINDPTQPLLTVADLGSVWVTALVPERDLAAVTRGLEAEVSLEALPGRTLRGRVAFVGDVVEPDTQRTRVRIAFANPGYELKPNMFGSVSVHAPARARVVVPGSALLIDNDRTSVFVATAPWTFERRAIETDLEEGGTVAVRSGLSAGEQVVVRGAILLND